MPSGPSLDGRQAGIRCDSVNPGEPQQTQQARTRLIFHKAIESLAPECLP